MHKFTCGENESINSLDDLDIDVQVYDPSKDEEKPNSYLRPNRYFKFYLFRQKKGATTCWLPEGFCV